MAVNERDNWLNIQYYALAKSSDYNLIVNNRADWISRVLEIVFFQKSLAILNESRDVSDYLFKCFLAQLQASYEIQICIDIWSAIFPNSTLNLGH